MNRNLPKRLVLLACMAFAGTVGQQLLLSALPGEFGAAYAKDGDSGGNGGGSGDGGSSNSGSSSNSSGSGSGHGSDDDNSGPGSGDDDARDDNSGSGKGRGGVGKRDAVSRYFRALRSQGRVVSASINGSSIDVRYDDGWRETINGNRYRLYDANGRRVVERSAVGDDFRRLRAVAQ